MAHGAPLQASSLRFLAPIATAALHAGIVQPIRRFISSFSQPAAYAQLARGQLPAPLRRIPRPSMPLRRSVGRVRRARPARYSRKRRSVRSRVRRFRSVRRRGKSRSRPTRRGRYRGRVARTVRARKRKSARLVLQKVVPPSCLEGAQNLQMAIWSPGVNLSSAPYGVHNSTGFNRWGMRTVCNLQDPRMIYAAAESIADGQPDNTQLKIYSMGTGVTFSNRSALPVYVEVLKVKLRGAEIPYTGSNNEWTFSLNGSGDLHVPMWDHPLTTYLYSGLETIEKPVPLVTTAADVYSPAGGTNMWSFTDFLSYYKITGTTRRILKPGKSFALFFKRMEEQMLSMTKYYAMEVISTATRRLDHMVGNELLFVRIHGMTCANKEGDGTEPRIGWAPSEILAEVRQSICYQVAPEGSRHTAVRDFTPTTGFVTGYTIGRAPYSANDVGRAGIAHVSATETSTAQVT